MPQAKGKLGIGLLKPLASMGWFRQASWPRREKPGMVSLLLVGGEGAQGREGGREAGR
jgi:hypothetical protein